MLSHIFVVLILPTLAMLISYCFMAQVLPLRKGWQWRIPISLLIAMSLSIPRFVYGLFSIPGYISRLAVIPLVLLLVPLWLFQGPKWKRLIVWILICCGQMLGEAFSFQVFIPRSALDNVDAFFVQSSASLVLLYGALSQGVSINLYILVVIFARTLQARRFSFIYLPVLFLPLSLSGMLLGHYMNYGGWLWFSCMLLGCSITIILLYYVVSLEEKDALKRQIQELQYTMALEQAHYRTIEERREALARIRHDFNNHLSTIGRLMVAGEVDDAQQMIARLEENIAATRETPYCSIPVINAVLEEKAQLCQDHGIDFQVSLGLPADLAVEPLHLCSVFANLVDNAIHGVIGSGQEQPKITLSSKTDGDYLFIKTVNPSAAPPKSDDPAARQGGCGIRICNSIAEQYGGSYRGSFANGIYTALVSLLAN